MILMRSSQLVHVDVNDLDETNETPWGDDPISFQLKITVIPVIVGEKEYDTIFQYDVDDDDELEVKIDEFCTEHNIVDVSFIVQLALTVRTSIEESIAKRNNNIPLSLDIFRSFRRKLQDTAGGIGNSREVIQKISVPEQQPQQEPKLFLNNNNGCYNYQTTTSTTSSPPIVFISSFNGKWYSKMKSNNANTVLEFPLPTPLIVYHEDDLPEKDIPGVCAVDLRTEFPWLEFELHNEKSLLNKYFSISTFIDPHNRDTYRKIKQGHHIQISFIFFRSTHRLIL